LTLPGSERGAATVCGATLVYVMRPNRILYTDISVINRRELSAPPLPDPWQRKEEKKSKKRDAAID
jgi:hypothetical protein